MITQAELKDKYRYDMETGIFYKILKSKKTIKKFGSLEKPVGTMSGGGYLVIRIKGKAYKVHALAWLYVYGAVPRKGIFIDHINRIKTDNRISNLRLATPSENQRNIGVKKNNTSGHRGVYWSKSNKNWFARIYIDGEMISLGSFLRLDDAIGARNSAERHYGYFGE